MRISMEYGFAFFDLNVEGRARKEFCANHRTLNHSRLLVVSPNPLQQDKGASHQTEPTWEAWRKYSVKFQPSILPPHNDGTKFR